ncbi:MAG: LL-diaminopimelate aminotransferase [Candidatus Omnitrophica bacterium]|nr:LL-diaminopimelate aminotransferase [Candidatus Omnitrophota bacterium]
MQYSETLKKLPTYLFLKIEQKKKELLKKGIDIIDFGVGDPDLPTPKNIICAMGKAVEKPQNHRYPLGTGTPAFKEAIAQWYRKRFSVSLNPEKEILVLLGSKEGLGHLPLAFLNKGDLVLIPEPAYPVYRAGTILAGGIPYFLPLKAENNFLPDLKSISRKVAKRAKLLFLNYPNNPTASVASKEFFEKAVDFSRNNDIVVLHDAAYSEIYYEEKPLSFLQIEGAKGIGIEFGSLSKTYNMTGWRIGWACGSAEVLEGLARVKGNIDSGTFLAIQEAGVEALNGPQEATKEIRRTYEERRDILFSGLKKGGWELNKPSATFYLWARVPAGYTSEKMASILLEKSGILATPGSGFGPSGEGYLRFSLTIDKERIKEAIERLKKIKL